MLAGRADRRLVRADPDIERVKNGDIEYDDHARVDVLDILKRH